MATEKRRMVLNGASPIKYPRRETRLKKRKKINVERTTQKTQEVISMADLKSLLGDKYKEGMTIEDIMSLEVETDN